MAPGARDAHEERIVAFARDLIAIPSENPPGAHYGECVARIGAELETLGIAYELVDTGDGELPRQAIVGSVVDSGPLRGTVWHACRGAFSLRVTTRGKGAHVGLRYEGANAFGAGVDVVLALRELDRRLRERRSELAFASDDPRARESIMLVGGVSEGGTSFNVIPDRFSFTVDRRPNSDEDFEEARRELLALLEETRGRGADVEWEVLRDAPSAVVPADSEFWRRSPAPSSA